MLVRDRAAPLAVLEGVFMLTARHTGTRWLRRNLRVNGYMFAGNCQRHVEDRHIWGDELGSHRLLVTVRHPVARAFTHINNFQAVDWSAFDQLRQLVDTHDSFVFRVDCRAEERASQVAQLADWLGVSLPEWSWDHSAYHRPDLWPSIRAGYERTGRLIENEAHPKWSDHRLIDAETARWLAGFYPECEWIGRHAA